jgi:hypothetical protein
LGQGGKAGFAGGGSIYLDKTATGPAGEAKAGFEKGFAVSAWGAHNMYRYVSGEIRHTFGQNNLKVSSGSESYLQRGRTPSYDVLLHIAPAGAAVRPTSLWEEEGIPGNRRRTAVPALQEFVLLTKATEWRGLAVFGAGVKFAAGAKATVRIEVLDYFSQFPTR